MGKVRLSQLRSWHRKLDAAHTAAVAVSDAANKVLGEDSYEAIIISDPIIELHAALSQIEGLIEGLEAATPNTAQQGKEGVT